MNIIFLRIELKSVSVRVRVRRWWTSAGGEFHLFVLCSRWETLPEGQLQQGRWTSWSRTAGNNGGGKSTVHANSVHLVSSQALLRAFGGWVFFIISSNAWHCSRYTAASAWLRLGCTSMRVRWGCCPWCWTSIYMLNNSNIHVTCGKIQLDKIPFLIKRW